LRSVPQRNDNDYGTFFRDVISAMPILTKGAPRQPAVRPSIRHSASVLVAASATIWPLLCQAIGLGPLAGTALIGEPLRLEIPLTGSIDQPFGSECISVRRVHDAIDTEYFPRDLVARVDRQTATPRVVLESRSALRQPLVEFQVFVSCGFNLSHDYLLLPVPRKEPTPVAESAPAPAPLAVQSAATIASRSTTPVVAAPTVAASTQLPDGIAGKNIVLDREMTLEQLARRQFPGPLRQQRFMRWVVEANPQYFVGAGKLRQHRLPSGAALVIPDGVPPRRPGDHQGNLTPLGEKIAAADGVTSQRASPAQTTPADRGATRADGAKDHLVVGGGTSARNMKEAVALIDQLTGVMEKQVAAQTSYNDKIQQLEATVNDLGKQLKNLDAEAKQREAQWQAERQAEKAAREQEAEREWWKLLAAVVGGGLLVGGALVALKTLFARKEEPSDDIGLVLPTDEPAPAAVDEAAEAAPLTEFGWDDEPGHQPSPAAIQPARSAPTAPMAPAAAPVAPRPPVQPIDFEFPTDTSIAQAQVDDPAGAAIELANIMTSMGLTESAAQTLVEHIRENPRESLPQWLKLLEIHRMSGNRSEFERSASELRQHFNVQPDDWAPGGTAGRTSLESYPHIRAQVVKLWRRPECATLLRALLLDNREGTRVGFPLAVAEEILLLIAIQNSSK
jgi:pilus assembly protein FimV